MPKSVQHILILSSWYPTMNSPFLGNFVQRQAELLSKSYKITVLHIVPENGRKIQDCIVKENGQLTEISIYHPKGINFISRRKEQNKAFESGMGIIKNVDLIHAHVLLPSGHLFVKAKIHFSCPLVLTEHGSYYRKEKRNFWNLKENFILRYTKSHIDSLIAVSEVLKNDMSSYFPSHAIQVIPNPINTDLFIPAKKKPSEIKKFLHISTLDKDVKNPKGIIDAIELLKIKGYKNMELTIISDESYLEWNKYVISKDLIEFVKFKGPFSPEELVSYYQQSDAFILFSSYETFSIVLAEAWACGIPTITTSVGIANDLAPELGLVVEINDSLSLAMGIEKILNGLEFNSSVIRKHALNFSEQRVLTDLINVYNRFNG